MHSPRRVARGYGRIAVGGGVGEFLKVIDLRVVGVTLLRFDLALAVKLLYDYYKESFEFTEEELVDEPTPDNMWIHSSCALWNPDISIKDNSLKGFESIPVYSFLKTCQICHTSIGSCVKCSKNGCNVYFHVECGRRVKLFMEMLGNNNPDDF